MGQYRHHVFVCTHGKHCAKHGGDDVYDELKGEVKRLGGRREVRVNRAGCMGQCAVGPMVVVHPDDVWYARVDESGARRIAREHLAGGQPAADLVYHATPGDHKKR